MFAINTMIFFFGTMSLIHWFYMERMWLMQSPLK